MALQMDADAVDRLANEIARVRDTRIATLIGNLRKVGADVDAAWDGTAQTEFTAYFNDWIGAFDHASNDLHLVAGWLHDRAREWREEEARRRAEEARLKAELALTVGGSAGGGPVMAK
jgi:WXG100 family type VII secretion target